MTTPIGKPKNPIGSLVAIIILTVLASAPARLEAQTGPFAVYLPT